MIDTALSIATRALARAAARPPPTDEAVAAAAERAATIERAAAVERETMARRRAANAAAPMRLGRAPRRAEQRREAAAAVAEPGGMVAFRLSWLRRDGVGGAVVAVLTALGDADLDHPGRGLLTRGVVDALDGGLSMDGARRALRRAEAAGLVRSKADGQVQGWRRWRLVTPARTVTAPERPEGMAEADWDAAASERRWGGITVAAAARAAAAGRPGLASLVSLVALSAQLGEHPPDGPPPERLLRRCDVASLCDRSPRSVTRHYATLRTQGLVCTRPPTRRDYYGGLRIQLPPGVRQSATTALAEVAAPMRR